MGTPALAAQSPPCRPVGTPVLHLTRRFYVGGSERQFIERLRAHPRGYEPIVACCELSGGNLTDYRSLGLPAPHVFPLRGSLLRPSALWQAFRIAALIRRTGTRVVHGTDYTTNVLGLVAARIAGVPVIVSRVDLGHLREGFGRAQRSLEKLVSRSADAVCANADAVRALCIGEEGCDPERVFVVRNGLDLARFDRQAEAPLDEPLPAGRPLVAVIANLWPVKGHRTLLEAVARIRLRRSDVRFALVGDGPERAFLLQRAAELGLTDQFALLGTRYDVPAILSRCDAACHPSLAEGLPNAVMEAMAARLPVVATAVGGVPELVADGRTGFLAPPGDAARLADRLLAVLADPERARAMGAEGRRRIERELSLDRLRADLGTLYDSVSSPAPAALRPAA